MGKIHGGFRLKHRVAKLFRPSRPTRRTSYVTRLFKCLKKKTMSLLYCCSKSKNRGYVPLLTGEKLSAAAAVAPKGHMVVYVGQNEERFMIPVMYFNHPLFGKLLSEVEEEFGFDHPGGITIPCRVSDFETVQSRIAAAAGGAGGGRKFLKWI